MVSPDDCVTLNVVMFTFYVLLFYRDFFSFDSVPTNWPGQKKSHWRSYGHSFSDHWTGLFACLWAHPISFNRERWVILYISWGLPHDVSFLTHSRSLLLQSRAKFVRDDASSTEWASALNKLNASATMFTTRFEPPQKDYLRISVPSKMKNESKYSILHFRVYLQGFKETVNPQKLNFVIIIYCFLCKTQKEMLSSIVPLLFSIQWKLMDCQTTKM